MTDPETNKRKSVLYESGDRTTVVLDIPRTLEESQVPESADADAAQPTPARRIYSAQPVSEVYDTPEPKRNAGFVGAHVQGKSPAGQIADLMTTATVQNALGHIDSHYRGPLHLPRLVTDEECFVSASSNDAGRDETGSSYIPDQALYYHGSIQDLSDTVRQSAPVVDLIILDPPWPNRSARRKANSYATTFNMDDMHGLLEHVPIATHLARDGLVAIWITNKSSVLDFVTSPSGLFASLNLEQVAEWTWLKITSSGEPIYDVNSSWRKPWEKLLIAKRLGAKTPQRLVSKTLIAVPDLHSRKPNLRGLFAEVLGPQHKGLEVFARNLTAGWWSWGDEVLKFQQREHWVVSKDLE